MEDASFKEHVKRLSQVNKAITQLDPAIRSQAFELLLPFVTGANSTESAGSRVSAPTRETGLSTLQELLTKHGTDDPADNCKLIAVHWYAEYGNQPLPAKRLKELADAAGITIPSRPDNTLRNALSGGKHLFQVVGRGSFRPTLSGELLFKATYGVRKGAKPLPTSE